jgi:malate permease and related proteins
VSIAALLRAIAPILLLVGVGITLRATGVLKRGDAKALNGVIIYAALPALIFSVVAKTTLSIDLARAVGVAWAVSLVGIGLAWALTRLMRLPDKLAGGFIVAAAFGNTGYLGYPVVRALLGDRWLPPAVFFDVFGTVAVMLVVAIPIAAYYGEHDEGGVNILREVLTFPAVIAMLLGLAFQFVPVPAPVSATVVEWTGFAGTIAAPLIMISLGVSLDFGAFKGASVRLGALTGVKLLVLPALAVGFAWLLGDHSAVRMLAMEAGMPTALLALIVSQRFKLDAEFVAVASLTTTVCCAVTIPLVQLLVR